MTIKIIITTSVVSQGHSMLLDATFELATAAGASRAAATGEHMYVHYIFTWHVPGWRGRLRRNLLYSGGSSLGIKGLPALLTLVLTGGTGTERGGVTLVFFPAFFVKLAGLGVCPRGRLLSFECLFRKTYDICDILDQNVHFRGIGNFRLLLKVINIRKLVYGHAASACSYRVSIPRSTYRTLSLVFRAVFGGTRGQCVIRKSARAPLATCFYVRDTKNGR
jgi:hypothetical protein